MKPTSIEQALKTSKRTNENCELKGDFSDFLGFENIITQSRHMQKALNLARKVAAVPQATVAIYGESGTGKELLARAIHQHSGCLNRRFVAVNCSAIPGALFESELFGHVKGAFTGATNRQGKFDQAQQGSLLLDEIGDMPIDIQPKLLRVLEERYYGRVGSNKLIAVDTRVITTTHQDLEKLITYGNFRQDLFHRINGFPIFLPPLRDRKKDIPLLVNYFLEEFQRETGRPLSTISKSGMSLLTEYDWPGNIRELKNLVKRAAIITKGKLITPEHLVIDRRAAMPDKDMIRLDIQIPVDAFSLSAATDQIKKIILERCRGNKAKASELLKISLKKLDEV